MKRFVIVALLAGTASAAPVGSVAVVERSVAHVNNVVIWQSDYNARASVVEPKERPAVLDAMIDEELVIAAAKQASITVDQSEVLAALDEIKTQNNISDKDLDKVLGDAGYTRAHYMVDLERQLMVLRAKNQFLAPKLDVTDADVEAEAKKRGVKVPVEEPDKTNIWRDLRRKGMEAEETKWIAELRKRAWIEKRQP